MDPKVELPAEVIQAIHADRKIEAIKLLRAQRNLDLKDAKHAVDAYVRQNPQLIVKRRVGAESGLGRIALVAVIVAAIFAAYRLLA